MAEVVTRHPDKIASAPQNRTYIIGTTPTGFELLEGPFDTYEDSDAIEAAHARHPGSQIMDGEWVGSLVGLTDKRASRHVAFGEAPPSPGVPDVDKTLRCCPFCGSGDIIGNSDKTVTCGFCSNRFQIILEAPHPFMPSALDGVPGPEIVGPDGTSPLEEGNGVGAIPNDPNAPFDPMDPNAPVEGEGQGGLEGFRTDKPAQPGATMEQFRVARKTAGRWSEGQDHNKWSLSEWPYGAIVYKTRVGYHYTASVSTGNMEWDVLVEGDTQLRGEGQRLCEQAISAHKKTAKTATAHSIETTGPWPGRIWGYKCSCGDEREGWLSERAALKVGEAHAAQAPPVETDPDACERCGGTGVLPEFMHIRDGVCFQCGGTKKASKTAGFEPVIRGTSTRWGERMVYVEPYRATNVNGEYQIDGFEQDTGNGEIWGTGLKIKKDGTPGNSRSNAVRIPVPDNVRAAFEALTSTGAKHYLTAEGALAEPEYLRHLALSFADDKVAVLPQIRAEHKRASEGGSFCRWLNGIQPGLGDLWYGISDEMPYGQQKAEYERRFALLPSEIQDEIDAEEAEKNDRLLGRA